jgi:tetratricopeptide (TPR) repeat protein
MLRGSGYESFFLYYQSKLYPYSSTSSSEETINIREWSVYLGKDFPENKIRQLIYEYNSDKLTLILEGKSSDLITDDVSAYFMHAKNEEVIRYLLFVREIQPFVNGMSSWEGCAHDPSHLKDFFIKGENLRRDSKSEFIKLRLAYQLVRLAHYANDFEKCVNYYDSLVETSNVKSFIRYWALGHKAGSLKAVGRYSEAIYYYSLVFKNSSEKRESAFGSMRYTGIDYEEAFRFCKNENEKLTLIFMNALESALPDLEPLKRIYQMDPASIELEVLIMREVKKSETFFTDYFSYSETLGVEANDLIYLKNFILRAVEEGKVRTPSMWCLFGGYLAYLTKDYDEAVRYIEKISANVKVDKSIAEQARVIRTLINIDRADSITVEFENELLKEFQWVDLFGRNKVESNFDL